MKRKTQFFFFRQWRVIDGGFFGFRNNVKFLISIFHANGFCLFTTRKYLSKHIFSPGERLQIIHQDGKRLPGYTVGYTERIDT